MLLNVFSQPLPDPSELDTWHVTLRCGHRAEWRQHFTSSLFTASTMVCTECGDIRGVLSSELIAEAPARAEAARTREIRRIARREVERLRAIEQLEAAQRRVDELDQQADAGGWADWQA
ncbi:hypothetical protein [Microbacterium sp. NIBRBAC000506063]|uniref:hypothetical protein n=1 Tax=Microbacterium sp. NIBRBAC000506063 TaxID=2734618 RepID=UPI001BB55335|nr:hypothetical protein [Microbacterium sp. NIBRBAC000506063]QTV80764.1 hypothetical protein KAE78_15020 [Microbacterium sp. NIBRBAC000506063]